jgi:hypothetical protein
MISVHFDAYISCLNVVGFMFGRFRVWYVFSKCLRLHLHGLYHPDVGKVCGVGCSCYVISFRKMGFRYQNISLLLMLRNTNTLISPFAFHASTMLSWVALSVCKMCHLLWFLVSQYCLWSLGSVITGLPSVFCGAVGLSFDCLGKFLILALTVGRAAVNFVRIESW